MRQLQRRERMPRVSGGCRRDRELHVVADRRLAERGRTALQHGQQVVLRMTRELVQPAARDERADHRVERVLGGRADQDHEARLDDRQQRVLLRLVEAMDLVDEEHRALPARAQPLAGARDHGLHVGLAGRDCGELLEDRPRARRDDARERGLARAGRPEEQRRGDAVLLDRAAQRGALADQLGLARELVQRARAQAVGERRVGGSPQLGRVVEQAHGGTLGARWPIPRSRVVAGRLDRLARAPAATHARSGHPGTTPRPRKRSSSVLSRKFLGMSAPGGRSGGGAASPLMRVSSCKAPGRYQGVQTV